MPRPLEAIAPYYVERRSNLFALVCPEQGTIADDYETYASACYGAHDLLDQAADEAAAEQAELAESVYQDKLDELRALVNAQGGYVAPGDWQGHARGRAIDAVLAAIDGIGASVAEAA